VIAGSLAPSCATCSVTVQARGIDVEDVHLRALAEPSDLVGGGVPSYRRARVRYEVLDPRRIEALADGTPIADIGTALAGLARPAIALLPGARTSSWIGGAPQLPAATSWPRGGHGPMTFVAQLTLGEFDPSVWTGPTTGRLHVFCDIDPESRAIEGASACTILHSAADPGTDERSFPSDLYVVLPTADLAAGRFDRAEATIEHD
jgi:hypothetical protein